jgi:hypothetical protein
MIVYSTQDYWAFELCPSSGIRKNIISETGSVPVLRWGEGHLRTETDPESETFYYLEYRTMDEVKVKTSNPRKKLNTYVMSHHQNVSQNHNTEIANRSFENMAKVSIWELSG